MLIIGIDPGISGSICFFEDGIINDVVEMPTMIEGKKNKRQVNGAQIFNEINQRINKNDKKNILRGLMWKNFVHIKIETNKDVGRDEFRFIKSKTGKDITNEMALDKDISMA